MRIEEARFWEAQEEDTRCLLCPHNCIIPEGGRGLCGVRENRHGRIYSLVYGRVCALNPDPIEKKPLFHFLPGTRTYSVATVGCNLSCAHCQNYQISQSPRQGDEIYGRYLSPKAIVKNAIDESCASIAYTYTEPTIFLEYALDIAKLSKEKGLKNVLVSNGYMSELAADAAIPFIDAVNIDLKSFSDGFYRQVCGGRLEPVLSTIKRFFDAGVWVELTTLLIPGLNDSPKEMEDIASFIHDELGVHVPWHISRFHPDYKLMDRDATEYKKIMQAVYIGRDAGLQHVYGGNLPHGDYENTYCPRCKGLVIERDGYLIVRNNVESGRCKECKDEVQGIWS